MASSPHRNTLECPLFLDSQVQFRLYSESIFQGLDLYPGNKMQLSDIKKILHAEVIVGHDKLDIPIRAGAGSDLMSDLLRGPTSGVVLLTGLNNVQVIRSSIISNVVAVVLVRGKTPREEVIAQAREHDIPLLSTPFTMFSACGRLFSQGLRGIELKSSQSHNVA